MSIDSLGLKLVKHDSVLSFMRIAMPFLSVYDAEHNLIIGVCNHFLKTGIKSMILLCHVENFNGDVVACLMWSEVKYGVVISNIDSAYRLQSLSYFVDEVLEIEKCLEVTYNCATVHARAQEANEFAVIFRDKTGITFETQMKQGIYKLETLNVVPYASGSFRYGNKDDVNIMLSWIIDYGISTGCQYTEASALELVTKKTSGNLLDRVWFWLSLDNSPVAMANIEITTDLAAVIGGVYAPKEFRGKGYATAITAAISQMALNSGKKYCYLFTDLSNPISNRMYKNIGYNLLEEKLLLELNRNSNSCFKLNNSN